MFFLTFFLPFVFADMFYALLARALTASP